MDKILEILAAYPDWAPTPVGVAVHGIVALLIVAAVRATPTPKDDRFVMRLAAQIKRIPVLGIAGSALEFAFASTAEDEGEQ